MENPNDQISQIEERINRAWQEIVTMEERLKALPGQAETFTNSVDALKAQLDLNKEQITSINAHYSDYFAKADPATKTKLETVVEHHAKIEQFLKASTEVKNELTDFRELVFGSETTGKFGFKKELENLLEQTKTSGSNLHTEWSSTYKTLYDKIEGLLPGATATGLSKAYQDQKKSYSTPVLIWSIVFGVTVGGMMAFGLYVYAEVKSISESLTHILARLPFFIPAVWLAVFSSKQQSQFKRLQQEYAYKESLAKSFEAYKREIDQLPDSDRKTELIEKLIDSMVTMCGYNPSVTLENRSHEEKPPLPGSDIVKKVLGKGNGTTKAADVTGK